MSAPTRRASRSPMPRWKPSTSPATRSTQNGTTRSGRTNRSGYCSNCPKCNIWTQRTTTMPGRSMNEDDPLEDFARREITLQDVTKRVYVAGSGPAVIVMAEMPGISPHVARFARWVANESSPVTQWLRALARLAHQECGGPGVGAIGMCFTGNFALTMMLEPAMLAPVLAQPALPLKDPGGLEITPEELRSVRDRLEREDLTVLAYRFVGDRFCRAERFAAYVTALGDRFAGRVLPDSAANTDVAPFVAERVRCPHSVVTAHLIDEAGQPTIAARDEILSFFARRLVR